MTILRNLKALSESLDALDITNKLAAAARACDERGMPVHAGVCRDAIAEIGKLRRHHGEYRRSA